jgi:hypothetical protein
MDENRYVRVGNRLLEVDHYENGVPIIKAIPQEIRHPDGRVDITIHVPCLNIAVKKED